MVPRVRLMNARMELSRQGRRGFVAVVSLGLVVACGGSKPPPKAAGGGTVSSRCPDLTKADEVAAFDFATEYALSSAAGDKLKAAALAAMEVNALADKLDADLGIACSTIAHDLGNKGDWRSGNEACAAAIKAVQETRAKLGAKAQAKLVVHEPLCSVDLALVTKCASICDSSVPSSKINAECERKVGRCDGQCDGSCDPKSTMKCDGQCSGTCEGAFKGTCGGRCRGTCDGKPSTGACAGVCAGSCAGGAASGDCKGACAGTCKLAKPGVCGEGMCAGACSVELSEPKCAGEFKAPEVSTDCRARCDLAVMNRTECAQPHVGLVVTGADAKARDAAESLRSSVEKSYPGLMKLLFELGDKGSSRILGAQAVIDSARKDFKEMAKSGAAAEASERQLQKCFDEPFKKAGAAATTVKTGIDQAIGVRDETAK